MELLANEAAVNDSKEYINFHAVVFSLRYDPDRAAVAERYTKLLGMWSAGEDRWGLEWSELVHMVSDLMERNEI